MRPHEALGMQTPGALYRYHSVLTYWARRTNPTQSLRLLPARFAHLLSGSAPCMKPRLQPRSALVLRHAPDFCASQASSQVFSLAARAVPISYPTTPSHPDTDLSSSSSQPSANQIP